MSRSGYTDDCDEWALVRWRGAVKSALRGGRGQHFLRKLRDALDAMPEKALIAHEISDSAGNVCALGAVDPGVGVDPEDREAVANHYGIAEAMAAEIMFVNDEWLYGNVTPEARWNHVRKWVVENIVEYGDD